MKDISVIVMLIGFILFVVYSNVMNVVKKDSWADMYYKEYHGASLVLCLLLLLPSIKWNARNGKIKGH